MTIEKIDTKLAHEAIVKLLTLLIQSSHEFLNKLSLEELEQTIISETKRVFGADAAWLLIYETADKTLKMRRYWGPCEDHFSCLSIKPSASAAGKVFLDQQPEIVFAKPVKADKVFDKDTSAEPVPVLVSFPITIEGWQIGVLGFSSKKFTAMNLSEAEIKFVVSIFASQVASAIKITMLFEKGKEAEHKLKNSIRSLQMLNEIGLDLIKDLNLPVIIRKVARYTAEILNADAAVICLGNKECTAVEKVYSYNMPPGIEEIILSGKSIEHAVFEYPRRVLTNDYPNHSWAMPELISAGLKSMILIPVISRGRVFATLEVVSFRDEIGFTEDNFDELEFVSRQMAIAIENARLYHDQLRIRKELEDYAQRLRMLNDFSQRITRETEPLKMVGKLVESARELLNCTAAIATLFKEGEWQNPTVAWSLANTNAFIQENPDIRPMIFRGLFNEWIGTEKPVRLSKDSGYLNHIIIPKGHLEIRGLLSVPMHDSEGNFMGQVILTGKKDGSNFSDTDEELLVALCAQVAIGIEKAQLYEQEHSIAETLQQAILAMPKSLPGVEVGIVYESAAEATKVGGDFYDLFELGDGRIGILIGDVSGKGLEAATITSMVKSTIRAFAYKGLSPSSVLDEANRVICRQLTPNQFVTMVYGVLDLESGKLIACRAGHPEIIIWDKDKCTFCSLESNVPIGVFSDAKYTESVVDLSAGQGIILYTDGLSEVRSEGRFLGDDELIDSLNKIIPGKDPQQIAVDLVSMVKDYTSGKPQDDIAIVALRLKK
ncbi:MAG: SpoIIE family protein phosphatase [Actinomycetota bacterium]|nr:SpoIIE family protein phosphatase [Actinomycetota bacterium]